MLGWGAAAAAGAVAATLYLQGAGLQSELDALRAASEAAAAAGRDGAQAKLEAELAAAQAKLSIFDTMEQWGPTMDWMLPPGHPDRWDTYEPTLLEVDDSPAGMARAAERWNQILDERTPVAWRTAGDVEGMDPDFDPTQDVYIPQEPIEGLDCHSGDVVVSKEELDPANFGEEAIQKAHRALTECGFVVLDEMFSKEYVYAIRDAYEAFKREQPELAKLMRYAVQGEGRYEHMLPFQPPFNETGMPGSLPYTDARLRAILAAYLGEPYKRELGTIITSKPGSKFQRWHQGWRYIWDRAERLPPYAVVVATPLLDLNEELGPTNICPRKKNLFYDGLVCPEEARVAAATSAGGVTIFDYKQLHVGPPNLSDQERPMLSEVFSKQGFMNGECLRNRALNSAQLLTWRAYLQQWAWHPPSSEGYWVV